MNYVGKPLAYVLATPEQPDDADNTAAGRVRQRGERPRHRRVQPPVRLRRVGRLRLDRARRDHHPRAGHAEGLDRQGLRRASRSTTPRRSPSARSRSSTRTARSPTPTRRSASWSTPRAPATSTATTTTRPPTTSGCGTACTGPATSPTATPTAGSTSPAAPPTGCGSTARTSPPHRSSGSSSGCAAVNRVAVYAVPDEHVGDQVMAAIVLQDDADPDARPSSRSSSPPRPDLSAKAWPRYVRIARDLPSTATNKVLKRELAAEGATAGNGVLWTRAARGTAYAREVHRSGLTPGNLAPISAGRVRMSTSVETPAPVARPRPRHRAPAPRPEAASHLPPGQDARRRTRRDAPRRGAAGRGLPVDPTPARLAGAAAVPRRPRLRGLLRPGPAAALVDLAFDPARLRVAGDRDRRRVRRLGLHGRHDVRHGPAARHEPAREVARRPRRGAALHPGRAAGRAERADRQHPGALRGRRSSTTSRPRPTPEGVTEDDPWGGRDRVNVLLLGGDGGSRPRPASAPTA